MSEKKTITSDKLKGLEVDHDECRYAAPSMSTGRLRLDFGDEENDVRFWAIEFVCKTCKQNFYQYNSKFHEQIRAALEENGVDAR